MQFDCQIVAVVDCQLRRLLAREVGLLDDLEAARGPRQRRRDEQVDPQLAVVG